MTGDVSSYISTFVSVAVFLALARYQFRIDIEKSLFLLMAIWITMRVVTVIPIAILEAEGIIQPKLTAPLHMVVTVLLGGIALFILVQRMGKVRKE